MAVHWSSYRSLRIVFPTSGAGSRYTLIFIKNAVVFYEIFKIIVSFDLRDTIFKTIFLLIEIKPKMCVNIIQHRECSQSFTETLNGRQSVKILNHYVVNLKLI